MCVCVRTRACVTLNCPQLFTLLYIAGFIILGLALGLGITGFLLIVALTAGVFVIVYYTFRKSSE